MLNVILLVALSLLGWNLRQRWLEAHAHEDRVLLMKPRVAPAPPLPPRVAPAPLLPDKYADVALKMLFARDRNSNVILDPTPPPKEKPVPPFPVQHGVMIWPGVPTSVILSEKPGTEQQSYHIGDKIGEFQIADITNTEIVFQFDDKTFHKTLAELEDRSAPSPVKAAPPPPKPSTTAKSLSNETRPQEPEPTDAALGKQIGGNRRACVANDPNPSGAVVDGYRKVTMSSPMGGTICGWEKVQ